MEHCPGEQTPPDGLTRFVRVRNMVDDRFVEFDFAIGDPNLYVELVLPKDAFDIFCAHNQVVRMSEEQARQVDADMAKWRYGNDIDAEAQARPDNVTPIHPAQQVTP